MKLHKFDQSAWSSFAGCIRWPDGREPLIGVGVLDSGKEVVMVLDPTGACIVVEDHPVSLYGGWVLDLPFPTQDAAHAFGTGMETPTRIDDFLRLGFREA